jgi:hypothetical protein
MASVCVFEKRVSRSFRSPGTTSKRPQNRHSKKSTVKTFQFEEYEHPQKHDQTPKFRIIFEHEEVETAPIQTTEPRSNDISYKTHRLQATKAWRLVDSKTILGKRKYVRKSSKSTVARDDHDQSSVCRMNSESPNTRQMSKSPNPGGGRLQGQMFECFPLETRPCIQEAMDYCETSLAWH